MYHGYSIKIVNTEPTSPLEKLRQIFKSAGVVQFDNGMQWVKSSDEEPTTTAVFETTAGEVTEAIAGREGGSQ